MAGASRGPVFAAAAVQAAPVYLNRDATVDEACALIREAGRAGAQLVAFPEVFIPGFPHWIYLDRPQANERYFVELVREAVEVPGPVTDKLGQAARDGSAPAEELRALVESLLASLPAK